MKTKTIISVLFIIVVSILYFFGICQWDLPVYILCVTATIAYMFIFIRQEKNYNSLINQRNNFDHMN